MGNSIPEPDDIKGENKAMIQQIEYFELPCREVEVGITIEGLLFC